MKDCGFYWNTDVFFRERNEPLDDGYRLPRISHYIAKDILKYVINIGLDIFSLAPCIAIQIHQLYVIITLITNIQNL